MPSDFTLDALSENLCDGDPERVSSDVRGSGRLVRKVLVTKRQLELVDAWLAGLDTPSPIATRRLLLHVLYCYASYRYRYDEAGVPVPWYCIAELPDAPSKTEYVWRCLVDAGLVEVRGHHRGVCRLFVLPTHVAVAYAEAGEPDAKTRYDAVTGKRDRSLYRTELTYDGQHSWKEKSPLMHAVLSFWKGARCLANRPAVEAHLQRAREAANAAQEAAEAEGRAYGEVKRSLPYGPLLEPDLERLLAAKKAYREARQLAEKRGAGYAQDQHCWQVACSQQMEQAPGYPEGIVQFQPAYEAQMLSGRLTFCAGGPQNMSRECKAAMYSGILGLVNYDVVGSQTNKLVEEFEDAVALGAELDVRVLTEYAGKDALAEEHGVSRDVFKRAEHAPKFGAGFPHRTFEAAWKMAQKDAYNKVEDHGWGHGEARYRLWEDRVVHELPTMARTAYDVAADPDLDDPEAVYASCGTSTAR